MYISFNGYKTYYEIIGEESKLPPIIFLHGGPGGNMLGFLSLSEYVSLTERQWILYDQIGGTDLPRHLYKVETYIDELKNLINTLQIKEYYLLGHSWGGLLALLYTLNEKPKGLKGLILCSTLTSSKLWTEEAQRLIKYLSLENQKAINKAIETNDFTGLEYFTALYHYYQKYIYDEPVDMNVFIEEQLSNSGISKDENSPYKILWGSNEFYPQGSLASLDITSSLSSITVPSLILSGTDDESTPLINKTIYDNLGGEKKWVLFKDYRHGSLYDNKECVDEIAKFIKGVETTNGIKI